MGVQIDIAAGLQGRVRMGLAVMEPVTVREAGAALVGELEAAARELRERHFRQETSRALLIAYAPARLPPEALAAAVADAASAVARHCGGEPVERRLLPPGDAPEGWS